MKSLVTFLFIFLASSSWRCDEPEDTIDCANAANQMIGTWTGRTNYTNGDHHNLTLKITSSNDCFFEGVSSFNESSTSFVVTGSIDKYGWVQFTETKYDIDGGEYSSCTSNGSSSWSSPCNQWPIIRWRPGTKFHEARFRSDPFVLAGEFYGQGGGWRSQIRGDFTITK